MNKVTFSKYCIYSCIGTTVFSSSQSTGLGADIIIELENRSTHIEVVGNLDDTKFSLLPLTSFLFYFLLWYHSFIVVFMKMCA